jgi:hypothetical protein
MMSPNPMPLRILFAILISIAAHIIERKVIKPWRKRRREQRQARATSVRLARDVELNRQRIASLKNGRSIRTTTGTPIHRQAGR